MTTSLLIAAVSGKAQTNSLLPCEHALYRGFDSRLHVTLAGTMPSVGPPPVGMAVVRNKPVVGYADHLIAYSTAQNVHILPTPSRITGLLSTGDSLRLETAAGVFAMGEKGFERVALPVETGDTRIAQQGTKSAVLAHQDGSSVKFTGLTEQGAWLPMFAIEGPLHAFSWTAAGFAAVVGDTLYTVAASAKQMEVTAKDPSFAGVSRVCMIGPSAAVVVYPNTTVLYAHGLRTVLVAVSGECAWDGMSLYLSDLQHRALWKVDGLQAMEAPAGTAAFLQELVVRSRNAGVEGERAFDELARLTGFDGAAKLTQRPNPCRAAPPSPR